MKRVLGKIAGAVVLSACTVLAIALTVISGSGRGMSTCSGMSVEFVPEGSGMNDEEGIRTLVNENYGIFTGQKADSVGLSKIEKIIDSESYVKKSQVYLTDDGVLHVRIVERTPEIRFTADGNTWYADRTGKVFRAPGEYAGDVPVAYGRPLEGEKGWINGILDVASYMVSSQTRGIPFSAIDVMADGSIILKAADGNERFVFGKPGAGQEARFRRIDRYYRDIRPQEKKYRTVDVRYKGQIICK